MRSRVSLVLLCAAAVAAGVVPAFVDRPVAAGLAAVAFLVLGWRVAWLLGLRDRTDGHARILRDASVELSRAGDREAVVAAAEQSARALAEYEGAQVELARVLTGPPAEMTGHRLGAPVTLGSHPVGDLTLVTDRKLPREAERALEALAGQLALRLEGAALADELLRRKSDGLYRSLVRGSPDVVAVLDPDSTLRYHSPATADVLGRDGSLAGLRLSDLVALDDRESLLAFLRTSADGPMAFRVHRPDGSTRVLEAAVSDLRGDPHVGGLVVTLRDVTRRDLRGADAVAASEPLDRGLAAVFGELRSLADGLAGPAGAASYSPSQ
jgi:PAS domain S-box-containing protein